MLVPFVVQLKVVVKEEKFMMDNLSNEEKIFLLDAFLPDEMRPDSVFFSPTDASGSDYEHLESINQSIFLDDSPSSLLPLDEMKEQEISFLTHGTSSVEEALQDSQHEFRSKLQRRVELERSGVEFNRCWAALSSSFLPDRDIMYVELEQALSRCLGKISIFQAELTGLKRNYPTLPSPSPDNYSVRYVVGKCFCVLGDKLLEKKEEIVMFIADKKVPLGDRPSSALAAIDSDHIYVDRCALAVALQEYPEGDRVGKQGWASKSLSAVVGYKWIRKDLPMDLQKTEKVREDGGGRGKVSGPSSSSSSFNNNSNDCRHSLNNRRSKSQQQSKRRRNDDSTSNSSFSSLSDHGVERASLLSSRSSSSMVMLDEEEEEEGWDEEDEEGEGEGDDDDVEDDEEEGEGIPYDHEEMLALQEAERQLALAAVEEIIEDILTTVMIRDVLLSASASSLIAAEESTADAAREIASDNIPNERTNGYDQQKMHLSLAWPEDEGEEEETASLCRVMTRYLAMGNQDEEEELPPSSPLYNNSFKKASSSCASLVSCASFESSVALTTIDRWSYNSSISRNIGGSSPYRIVSEQSIVTIPHSRDGSYYRSSYDGDDSKKVARACDTHSQFEIENYALVYHRLYCLHVPISKLVSRYVNLQGSCLYLQQKKTNIHRAEMTQSSEEIDIRSCKFHSLAGSWEPIQGRDGEKEGFLYGVEIESCQEEVKKRKKVLFTTSLRNQEKLLALLREAAGN